MNCGSRRAFCAAACRTASGVAAALLAGHSGMAAGREVQALPTIRGESADGVVRAMIAATPLAAVGGIARVVSNAGSFLVTRDDERACTVLSANCSHEACLITAADAAVYVCDCHGSRFDTKGQVLEGPAELPLFAFSAVLEDGVLVISLP